MTRLLGWVGVVAFAAVGALHGADTVALLGRGGVPLVAIANAVVGVSALAFGLHLARGRRGGTWLLLATALAVYVGLGVYHFNPHDCRPNPTGILLAQIQLHLEDEGACDVEFVARSLRDRGIIVFELTAAGSMVEVSTIAAVSPSRADRGAPVPLASFEYVRERPFHVVQTLAYDVFHKDSMIVRKHTEYGSAEMLRRVEACLVSALHLTAQSARSEHTDDARDDQGRP